MEPRPLHHALLLLVALVVCADLSFANGGSARHLNGATPSFTENRGQLVDRSGARRDDILFTARAGGAQLYFMRDRIGFVFSRIDRRDTGRDLRSLVAGADVSGWRVDMRMIGADRAVRVVGGEPQGVATYIRGDRAFQGVTSYRTVRYEEIYPNIDLLFYIEGENVRWSWVVKPGGDIDDIRIGFDGAERVLASDGTLRLRTPVATIVEREPEYRVLPPDGRSEIRIDHASGSASLVADGDEHRYELPVLAQSTVVLLPKLEWSHYIGGTAGDRLVGVTSDTLGNIFIAGESVSTEFPTTAGAFQMANAGAYDAVVAKLDSNGNRVWSTYFGGTGNDMANGIALDPLDNVVVVGYTQSLDFPVTELAYQDSLDGGQGDGFMVKLDGNGVRVWSTYIGGDADDIVNAVECDNQARIYITGYTLSRDFPVTAGAFQTNFAGSIDVFVGAFDAAGIDRWVTYVGGVSDESGNGIAVDADGYVSVVGQTSSRNFPTTPGAFRPQYYGGDYDGFLFTTDPSGARQWCTYVGGGGDDRALGVATTPTRDIVLTGHTSSLNFPTSNALQPQGGGGEDAFVAYFSSTGSRRWATYYGGDGDDYGTGVAVDSTGTVVVAGYTNSVSLTSTPDAVQAASAGMNDAFIARISSTGTREWASYFGGSADDGALDVSVGMKHDAIVVGYVSSDNMPGATNTRGGAEDGFIARISFTDTTNTDTSKVSVDDSRSGGSIAMRVMPNPASSRLSIAFTLDRPSLVSGALFSIDGSRVAEIAPRQLSNGDDAIALDLTNVTPGVYLLRVDIDGRSHATRVVVR